MSSVPCLVFEIARPELYKNFLLNMAVLVAGGL